LQAAPAADIGYPGDVAARHLARIVGWVAACVMVPVALGAAFGRTGSAGGVAGIVIATLLLVLWLPRAAHAAFEAARYGDAIRRYRVIAATAVTATRERAGLLSCAGCDLAAGRLAAAGRLLARFDGETLDTAERVTWLNNRACVALEAGGDPHGALSLADAAVALRPDVPAVQHTRAKALIAVGRVDDAIGVLEAMRTGGELPAALEAARCRELALAWAHKGQLDYAADYRDRARIVAG
jgi:tetratricopeptide (TPR) repeat protein